jgi:hypothetical protein
MFSALRDSREARWLVISDLLIVALFFTAFWPALTTVFGAHNDYLIWAYDNKECCLAFPESKHLVAIGRILGAVGLNAYFALFTDVESLTYGRLFGTVFLIGVFFLFQWILIARMRLNPWVGTIVSATVLILPSSILFTVWLANFVPGTLTVALAALAFVLVHQARDAATPEKRRNLTVAGWGVFIASLFIYPPSSLAFLLFPVLFALFADDAGWQKERAFIFRQVAYLVGLLFAYFLFTKFINFPLFTWLVPALRDYVMPTENYQVALSLDLTERVNLLIELLWTVFNLWGANFVPWLCVVVAGLPAAVLAIKGLGTYRAGNPVLFRAGVERVLVAGVILALSLSPVMATKGGFIAFRILFAPTAIAAAFFLWAVYTITQGVRLRGASVAAGIAVLGLGFGMAAYRTDIYVENMAREYAFVQKTVEQFPPKASLTKRLRVLVRPPYWGDQIVRERLDYDFLYNGLNFARMGSMFTAALRKAGYTIDDIEIDGLPHDFTYYQTIKQLYDVFVDAQDAGYQGHQRVFSNATGPMRQSVSETAESLPTLLIADRNAHNIIIFRQHFIAIPFGIEFKYESKDYLKTEHLLYDVNLDELIRRVDAILPKDNVGLLAPRLVKEGYRDYNIVQYFGGYWGFPQGLEPVYKDYDETSKLPGVVHADSIDNVESQIDDIVDQGRVDLFTLLCNKLTLFAPRFIEENYRNYNIIKYFGAYWGFPQGLNPDYQDYEKTSGLPGLVKGASIAETKQRIDRMIDEAGPDAFPPASRADLVLFAPRLIEEDYRGYNIIEYFGSLWGLVQGLDPDYQDYDGTSRLPGIAKARTLDAVKLAIDHVLDDEGLKAFPERLRDKLGLLAPRLVKEGYRGYNLVSYVGTVWGFPQGTQPDYDDYAKLARLPGVVRGKTLEETQRLIDPNALVTRQEPKKPATIPLTTPKLIEEGYRDYNIVQFAGAFWGFPQGIQPNYDDKEGLGRIPDVFQAQTIAELKPLIDRKTTASSTGKSSSAQNR